MKDLSMKELEARRSALLRQLGRSRPLVEGSLAVVNRKCGTPTCKCHHGGEGHRQVTLCKKVSGRSHSTHVPKGLEETVRKWNQEHKRVKQLLKEISALSEQIIRSYVSSQRAAKKKPELRVLKGTGRGKARRKRGR
jgi:hypothetical protein